MTPAAYRVFPARDRLVPETRRNAPGRGRREPNVLPTCHPGPVSGGSGDGAGPGVAPSAPGE